MGKKIVFLPYDFDTAIGINNEGSLAFGYSLEDIDQTESGADVFNGQQSVLWKNVRAVFFDRIKSMYQTLRSEGTLSYELVEGMFEEHQAKWPEAVFNEDAWFKYLAPLVEKGSAAYLPMLQGSKAEQRKWWLYNRFRYIDSKYNAGDALTDVIQLRGYAKSNITVTPYADIYASVKYGSYLVQTRAQRGNSYTLICPLDSVNDTEIYIYSCSQLASVGDLSGLKVGFADFSKAVKLQELKIGDSSAQYSNGNLTALTLGNNTLLKKIDVRNCVGLGTADQKSVDISGCTNIEEVYFEGTSIQGVTLPNGGVLRKLHLPAVSNLTIMNQKNVTELSVASYANLSTLRIENSSVDARTILMAAPAGTRVRLVGFWWEAAAKEDIDAIFDKLDTMRGLNEYGDNMERAQVSGTIHIDHLTGAQIAEYKERYPNIKVKADYAELFLYYYNGDGTTLLHTENVLEGASGTWAGTATKDSTAQYSYTFTGWSRQMNAETAQADARDNMDSDRNVYAAFAKSVRTYTVRFLGEGGTPVLQTVTDVPYGGNATYTGETPTKSGNWAFDGFAPTGQNITGDTDCTAQFVQTYTITWMNGSAVLETDSGVRAGTIPTYDGETPVYPGSEPEYYIFNGWTPEVVAVDADTTYSATYLDTRSPLLKYLNGDLEEYESDSVDKIGEYSFYQMPSLVSVKAPATVIERYAFTNSENLKDVELTSESLANMNAQNMFDGCYKLERIALHGNAVTAKNSDNIPKFSPMFRGKGAIFVPTNLIPDYKAHVMWGKHTILPIDLYPTDDYSTIRDSWTEIFAAEQDASYKTKYSIGDIKRIQRSDGSTTYTYYMQIVAFDEGTSKISWVSLTYLTTRNMNSSASKTGGYIASDMNAYLEETIYPEIEEDVRNHIVDVAKTSVVYTGGTKATVTNNHKIWLPSAREITGETQYENSGVDYTAVFSDAEKRKKYGASSSTADWWLRTAKSDTEFRYASGSGNIGASSASTSNVVIFGFCT